MNRKQIGSLYHDINFLPVTYTRSIETRWTLRRTGWLASVMLLAISGLMAQQFHSREALRELRNTYNDQLHSAQNQIDEYARLQREQSGLQKQLAIHRQLKMPIDYSHITGTLASLMPEEITVRVLDLRNDMMSITAAGTDKKTERHFVSIELQGVAPSDVNVANFIGQVAGSKLFRNVKMLYSRQGKSDATASMREFCVHMEVPLDCQYAPVKDQEVADAH